MEKYDTISRCEETPEVKTIRKKDREIERLEDVIVYQVKKLLDVERDYEEVIACNSELRDAIHRLYREQNDMFDKISEIKELLRLAKECAGDATKSQRQRDVSKIRVECLQDVIDIFKEKGNEEKQ